MTDPILATRLLSQAERIVTVRAPVEAGAVTGVETRGQRRIINHHWRQRAWPPAGAGIGRGTDFRSSFRRSWPVLDARYVLALDSGEHVLRAEPLHCRAAG